MKTNTPIIPINTFPTFSEFDVTTPSKDDNLALSSVDTIPKIKTITILGNKTVLLNTSLDIITPSTPRYKNYLAKLDNIPQFPSTLDLRNNLGPVRDQGSIISSSAAFAACVMIEWQVSRDSEYKGYFSPSFLYVRRPSLDHQLSICDALRTIKFYGVCKENSFSFNYLLKQRFPHYVTSRNIPFFACKEAYYYKRGNDSLIETINELKTALYLNGPCIFTVYVYSPYGRRMWIPNGSTDNYYHSMAIVGYNSNGFIIRNNWSTAWNPQNTPEMAGYDYLPEEDFNYLISYYGQIWTMEELIPKFEPMPETIYPKCPIVDSKIPYLVSCASKYIDLNNIIECDYVKDNFLINMVHEFNTFALNPDSILIQGNYWEMRQKEEKYWDTAEYYSLRSKFNRQNLLNYSDSYNGFVFLLTTCYQKIYPNFPDLYNQNLNLYIIYPSKPPVENRYEIDLKYS